MKPWNTPLSPLKKTGLAILASIALGGLTSVLSSFSLAVHEPDYAGHLGVIYKLANGFWNPLPYNGVLGSHVAIALLMELTGLTGQQLASVFFWTSQYLVVSALYLAGGRALSLAFYSLGSLILVNMMLCRGYLPQVYSWAAYALGYALFFGQKRPVAGTAALLLGGWIYPDGLLWMLPVFAWNSPLSPPRRRLLIAFSGGIVLVLLATQIRYAALNGAANFGWLESGLLPAFVAAYLVYCIPPRVESRPLTQIVLLFLLISGLLALQNLIFVGSVRYYARKNFYFVGLLLPLLLAHLPLERWRRLALSLTALLALLAIIRMNGVGIEMVLPDMVRHTPAFDSVDERFIPQLQKRLAENKCGNVVVLPNYRFRSGPNEDPYMELVARVLAYNAWINESQPNGSDRLPALNDRYSWIYAIGELLRDSPSISLSEIGLKPGTCALVSDRYVVTDAQPAAVVPGPSPERDGFRLYSAQ